MLSCAGADHRQGGHQRWLFLEARGGHAGTHHQPPLRPHPHLHQPHPVLLLPLHERFRDGRWEGCLRRLPRVRGRDRGQCPPAGPAPIRKDRHRCIAFEVGCPSFRPRATGPSKLRRPVAVSKDEEAGTREVLAVCFHHVSVQLHQQLHRSVAFSWLFRCIPTCICCAPIHVTGRLAVLLCCVLRSAGVWWGAISATLMAHNFFVLGLAQWSCWLMLSLAATADEHARQGLTSGLVPAQAPHSTPGWQQHRSFPLTHSEGHQLVQ